MLVHIQEGFFIAVTMSNFFFMLLGVLLGLAFGVIPGLTFSTALILVIPFTFTLEPISAITLLLGIYTAGMAGGSVSSILLGIPGTPSAAATVLDGYPMAKKGLAGKALGTAVVSSAFGDTFSLLLVILVAPQIARMALGFGSPEIFSMVLFGMSTVIGLSGSNMIKGLMAGMFGLFLTTVGLDPIMGHQRFTFGQTGLMSGVEIMPLMIGMFALPEIIAAFQQGSKTVEGAKKSFADLKIRAELPTLAELRKCLPTLFSSSMIGTGVGAIPGTSGPIAAFLAYNVTKRRIPELGTGRMEGVAATESATNGVTGGALVPLLSLGIPADASTAIMLGAFLIHGVAPGPLLFRDNAPFVYAVFISCLVITAMFFIIQLNGIRLFVKVLNFPRINIMSIILVVSVVGAFAVKLNFIDIIVMTAAGLLAWFMKRYGFPVTPLILGVVLGRTIETSLRRSLILSGGDLSILVGSPVSIVFLSLTAFMLLNPVLGPVIRKALSKRKASAGG